MNFQRYLTLTMFFIFCLPIAGMSASTQYEDLTYGFLGNPLPPEVMLYEGVIDDIPEKGGVISLNDAQYKLMAGTLYLTTYKSKTSLKYFQPATSVKFYAHVQDRVIYEIMATSAPEQTGASQEHPSGKTGNLILQDGVWRN